MQVKSAKIKVLFILSALHKDGAVLSTLTTIKHLDKEIFEPRLVVLKYSAQSHQSDSWNNLIKEIDVVFGMTAPGSILTKLLPLFLKLLKLGKNTDIIVGGLEMGPTFLAIILGKFTAKPSVGFIRNSLPDLLSELSPKYKRLTQILYPHLTRGIAISNGIKQNVEKLIPKLKGKLSTVYIPIDIEEIRLQSTARLPEVISRQPYLLAVGRLMPQKGFDILLQAYAIARGLGVIKKLVIVGEGIERGKLEKSIIDLGLEGKAFLVGFQDNPYAWMKNAEIFISSSRFEGFCRVLAEAQAVGIPVISTDCPDGPAEVLQGGESGILVKNINAQELANAMILLTRDAELRKSLSDKGLERVKEFTLRATLSNFENILKNIVSEKKTYNHQ